MIRFSLHCAEGHNFDSWFSSSASFEDQQAKKLIICPLCGSNKIEKALMAPQLARKDRTAQQQPVAIMTKDEVAFRQKLRELHSHITQSAEHVGHSFSEEARKIHYGEAKARSIYGQTTFAEAQELFEEGIEVFALPSLPDDKN